MSDWGARLNLPAAEVRAAVEAGLSAGADVVLEAAVAGAPFLTGELAGSGTKAVDGNTAAVGFTDSKAVAAHENLHDRLRGGKRAKFLELALAENADTVARELAARVKGALS